MVRGGSRDAFTIKRLERGADKLASVDVVTSSILRSALTALEWEFDETQYWIQNALKNDRSSLTLLNSAISNTLLSQFDNVVELSAESIRLSPKNTHDVKQAASHLANRGYFLESIMALEALDANDEESSELLENVKTVASYLDIAEVAQERVVDEMRKAYAVAFSQKKRISACIPSVDEDSCLVIKLAFEGGLDDEFALERSFAEVLSNDPIWDPLKLSVEFAYTN